MEYRESPFIVVNWLRKKKTETEEAQQMAKLLYTLFFGFFAGVLAMILKQENLLYNTGFLDGYTLGPIKYLEPETKKLLITVFMQRIGVAVLLVILSTTYLGNMAAYLYELWSGLAAGILAAGSVIRYGMKGLLLIAGSLLPQQLILVPAFLLLSVKCCELCGMMYFHGTSGGFSGRDRGRFLLKKGTGMAGCIILIAVGCFVEAYINPVILKFILRLF